jgi:hypothetical protein
MTRLEPEDKSFIGIAQRRTEVAVFLARLVEVALTPLDRLLQRSAAIVRDVFRQCGSELDKGGHQRGCSPTSFASGKSQAAKPASVSPRSAPCAR